MSELAVTLVLDVGKTRTKLLAIDADGSLLGQWERHSRSLESSLGYPALDTAGIKDWLVDTMAELGALRSAIRAIVPITHGAAIAGVQDGVLVLPVPDYEFAGFNDRAPDWRKNLDPFDETLSPDLPNGLNLAAQLDWLERHFPKRAASVERWMPYAQYWAWWLSGIASTELSSLGCHSQLWRPKTGTWSDLAVRRGWARRFAKRRMAWDVIGPVLPALARTLGLPSDVMVHCGAHDSNACLARYLRPWPDVTLVSSGTWVVIMAAGAPLTGLDGQGDYLANVSVEGKAVPTGRFMGGRDVERLCAGADPQLADPGLARELLSRGLRIDLEANRVLMSNEPASDVADLPRRFDARERASIAALHAAESTLACLRKFGATGPVVVEGPLASNGCYLALLATSWDTVHVSTDAVEGTARGGAALAQWTSDKPFMPRTRLVDQRLAAARA